MRREARLAYEARNVRAAEHERPAEHENDDSLGFVLRATDIDTVYGPMVHLSAAEDRPGSTMFLLSAGLLRKLLAMARMAGPSGPGGGRPRRLDIRV